MPGTSWRRSHGSSLPRSAPRPTAPRLRALTAESNERLFRLVEESSLAFEQGHHSLLEPEGVRAYCERTQAQLIDLRDEYVADNLDPLAQVINADCASGPVLRPQIH